MRDKITTFEGIHGDILIVAGRLQGLATALQAVNKNDIRHDDIANDMQLNAEKLINHARALELMKDLLNEEVS